MSGVKTRIGIAGLVKSRTGSVELPEEVTLCCPRCKTECADKGDCLLELRPTPNLEKKPAQIEVRLMVDCRVCGLDSEMPILEI